MCLKSETAKNFHGIRFREYMNLFNFLKQNLLDQGLMLREGLVDPGGVEYMVKRGCVMWVKQALSQPPQSPIQTSTLMSHFPVLAPLYTAMAWEG